VSHETKKYKNRRKQQNSSYRHSKKVTPSVKKSTWQKGSVKPTDLRRLKNGGWATEKKKAVGFSSKRGKPTNKSDVNISGPTGKSAGAGGVTREGKSFNAQISSFCNRPAPGTQWGPTCEAFIKDG